MNQPATLTARQVYDNVPLGAVIRYFDGTPQPPARHRNKLAAWSSRNGTGRVTSKTPPDQFSGPSIKLHTGNFASHNVVVMQTYISLIVPGSLRFSLISPPQPGQFAVLQGEHGNAELLHLANNLDDAEAWLADNRYSNTRIQPADQPEPRAYTYLQDPAHGWLIVTRDDLAFAGFTAADFSICTYVSGDRLALEEDEDMTKFLKRLTERGIPFSLRERHTNGDAPVRSWASNTPAAS
jgi:hypothetical protein